MTNQDKQAILPAPLVLTLEQAKQVGAGTINPASVIKYIGGYLAGLAAS